MITSLQHTTGKTAEQLRVSKMKFYLYEEQVSGLTAEKHFVEWCLKLENQGKPVPRTSLDAIAFFQDAQRNEAMMQTINQSGIVIK